MTPRPPRVLILGGYGVFGGRLARLLIKDGAEVIAAGRSLEAARAFTKIHGGTPLALPRTDATVGRLRELKPDVVVDAAGPFQAYARPGENPYALPRAALAAGAHYLDLSDDADFAGGVAVLDAEAKAAGKVALSGVSSVPTISSAAVEALIGGDAPLTELALIESSITPGNRAPRGPSLMGAILSQTGRAIRLWRGGRWTTAPGWSDPKRIDIEGLDPRRACLIGAPDLTLFPKAFAARSVLFRAGLEVPTLHWGLWASGLAIRAGLARSLTPLARTYTRIADLFRSAGTDRGGMLVRVGGRDAEGRPQERLWSLVADAGDGPFIPALSAALLVPKLLAGGLSPGARTGMGPLSLAEIEAGLSRLRVTTRQATAAAPRLFEAALGDEWPMAPATVRRLHDIWDEEHFAGRARVTRGGSILARLTCAVFRFPPATGPGQNDIPVSVEIRRGGEGEVWTRDFDGRRFRSHLSPRSAGGDGLLWERFGPVRCGLRIGVRDGELTFAVENWRLFGLPMPRALAPGTSARESERDGRFQFNVDLTSPLTGLIVRYQGWLRPEGDK